MHTPKYEELCERFARTGNCVFGDACWYTHATTASATTPRPEVAAESKPSTASRSIFGGGEKPTVEKCSSIFGTSSPTPASPPTAGLFAGISSAREGSGTGSSLFSSGAGAPTPSTSNATDGGLFGGSIKSSTSGKPGIQCATRSSLFGGSPTLFGATSSNSGGLGSSSVKSSFPAPATAAVPTAGMSASKFSGRDGRGTASTLFSFGTPPTVTAPGGGLFSAVSGESGASEKQEGSHGSASGLVPGSNVAFTATTAPAVTGGVSGGESGGSSSSTKSVLQSSSTARSSSGLFSVKPSEQDEHSNSSTAAVRSDMQASSNTGSGMGLFGAKPSESGHVTSTNTTTSEPGLNPLFKPLFTSHKWTFDSGTTSVAFRPFVKKEPASATGLMNHFQNICFQDLCACYSPEELRLSDYKSGMRYPIVAGQKSGFAATKFGSSGTPAISNLGTKTGNFSSLPNPKSGMLGENDVSGMQQPVPTFGTINSTPGTINKVVITGKASPKFGTNESVLNFVVGEGQANFCIHKSFACHYSPVLRKKSNPLVGADPDTFILKTTTDTTFSLFSTWIYTQSITTEVCDAKYVKALLDLWVLGDLLKVSTLQNRCIDLINVNLIFIEFPFEALERIWARTASGSQLRRLLISHLASRGKGLSETEAEFCSKEILVELVNGMEGVIGTGKETIFSRHIANFHVKED